ncbi:MAG: ATP-binding cassette domain-containing protein, partial [Firmicutes bacterium]|nr:ATP-binding cassette domain-containing protein [Bacillota bacterium]
MIVLQASGISKSYGTKNVLNGAGITLHSGERVGLVGPNGAGKTTLLKILTGDIKPDAGEIFRPAGATLGYLAQDGGLSTGATVLNEMLSVFTPLINLEKKLRELEGRMGETEVLKNTLLFKEISGEYDMLLEDFRIRGGYEFRTEIKAVLHGLNFGVEYHHRPVDTLSGGQKTRLAMAKLLLARPDILVLDEPTNHLDMETMAWVEKYLQSYSGSILVVSHDRYFLNALAGTVYELERGRLHKYHGNYSRFVYLRAERARNEMKLYVRQQEEIARAEDFIHRNIARLIRGVKTESISFRTVAPVESP